GRRGAQSAECADRSDARARAGARPEPSRRPALLHPRGRSIGSPAARRGRGRPVARRAAGRRPHGAHAEPYLLPDRPLLRCASGQQGRGRRPQAKGDSKTAIAKFTAAAALQDQLRYTEPPYWYYPVRQSLAAALLQAHRLDEALDQFRQALARAPNNGWTYY